MSGRREKGKRGAEEPKEEEKRQTKRQRRQQKYEKGSSMKQLQQTDFRCEANSSETTFPAAPTNKISNTVKQSYLRQKPRHFSAARPLAKRWPLPNHHSAVIVSETGRKKNKKLFFKWPLNLKILIRLFSLFIVIVLRVDVKKQKLVGVHKSYLADCYERKSAPLTLSYFSS